MAVRMARAVPMVVMFPTVMAMAMVVGAVVVGGVGHVWGALAGAAVDLADAKQWLAERGFDPLYGARPLRRLVQQAIGDQLAKLLLSGDVHDGDVVPVNVSADGDGLVLG